MSQRLLCTPEHNQGGQDSSNRWHKYSHNTTASNNNNNEDDCPYCLMKRKFNIGASGQQKCLQHSVRVNVDENQRSESSQSSKNSDFMPAEEMVMMLDEVESGLDYYWDHLREISGGNPNYIHKELDPVLSSVKRLQQKIGKFFYDSAMDISEIKPISTQSTLHKKMVNTGSEKYLRVDLSHFLDADQSNPTQSIKEWVMYFHKMLQMRTIPEHCDPLPHESDLEMRIFKQSMERKFTQYIEQVKGYERKVRDVLGKLVFYMEKSTECVPQKQIQEDILFIEGQQQGIDNREAELERLLLMQAATMEHMLINGT